MYIIETHAFELIAGGCRSDKVDLPVYDGPPISGADMLADLGLSPDELIGQGDPNSDNGATITWVPGSHKPTGR